MTSKRSKEQPSVAPTSDKKESSTTIIVAVIGLIGVIITAIFGYMGTLAISTKEEVSYSAAQSDWLALIDFRFGWNEASCNRGAASVVPDYITLIEDDPLSLQEMEGISDKSPVAPWPDFGQEMIWGITISNNSSNTGDWIRINKNMTIKLDIISTNTPKHVSVWRTDGAGCGGENYKKFSLIKLNHDRSSLYQTIASDKYDYFSFQPGEFDTFEFDFVCAAPGLYRPIIEMEISYKGQSKTVALMGNDIILCPETFSLWFTDLSYYLDVQIAKTRGNYQIQHSPMSYSGEFFWNGTEYEEINP
ncbi:MAG: hypothetical protein ACOYYJ_11980 [Chloroflexota bacterium]